MIMSDLKSKLPDLKELASMTGKLITGIKDTVVEIIDDYKQKRETQGDEKPSEEKKAESKPKSKAKEKKSEE